MLSRRQIMAGALLPAAAVMARAGEIGPAPSGRALFDSHTDDPYRLAARAFVWGYPLVRAAQLRINTTRPDDPYSPRPPQVAGAPLNAIGHATRLSDPTTRLGVAPNNDTLYSLAWLDLSQGPFVLESPDFGDRYYVFQFGQADSSADRSLGHRTHGGQLPPVFIHGPDFTAATPPGMVAIAARYRYLMIAGRILVTGADDLPAVWALQKRIRLRTEVDYRADAPSPNPPPAQRRLIDPARSAPKALEFLEMLGAVLQDLGLRPEDKAIVESLGGIGLNEEHGFLTDGLGPAWQSALAEGLAAGEAMVRAKTYDLGRKINGWSINYAGARFGDDYLLRAAVAMDQIYIVEPEAALYPSGRVDSDGAALDGRNAYRIRFAAGELPPVGAFWSITLYYAKGFMVPNEIDRWAIGDRTPGLVFGPGQSLELRVQHVRPGGVLAANWLPAPEEPFMLLMRLYEPKPAILSGAWVPPKIERIAN